MKAKLTRQKIFFEKTNTKSEKAILLLKVVKCISENKNKNHIDSNASNGCTRLYLLYDIVYG